MYIPKPKLSVVACEDMYIPKTSQTKNLDVASQGTGVQACALDCGGSKVSHTHV